MFRNSSPLLESNDCEENNIKSEGSPIMFQNHNNSICGPKTEIKYKSELDYRDREYNYDLLCSICCLNQWKYKCPRCLVRTCSVSCVKLHKIKLTCSGIRDKTCYTPMSSYNENNLLSDYFFLEDVEKSVDVARRDTTNKNFRIKQKSQLNILKFEMKKRGIEFNVAPDGIAVRRLNMTFYNRKTKTIFWTLQFIFVDCQRTEYTSFKVNEVTKLSDVLLSYIHPSTSNEITKLKLKEYTAAYESRGLDAIVSQLIQPCGKFVTLEFDQNLLENFKDTIINETPKILVTIQHIDD